MAFKNLLSNNKNLDTQETIKKTSGFSGLLTGVSKQKPIEQKQITPKPIIQEKPEEKNEAVKIMDEMKQSGQSKPISEVGDITIPPRQEPSLWEKIKMGASKIFGGEEPEEPKKDDIFSKLESLPDPTEEKTKEEDIPVIDLGLDYKPQTKTSTPSFIKGQSLQAELNPELPKEFWKEAKTKEGINTDEEWKKFSEKNVSDKLRELKQDPTELAPFIGGAVETKRMVDLLASANRLNQDKATEEDLIKLKNYIEESGQDSTFSYKVLDTLAQLPSFAGELYVTGGTATATRLGARKTLKKLLTKQGKELLEKSFKKKGIDFASGVIARSVQAPFAGLTRIPAETLEKQVNEKIKQAETGEEAEPLSTSLVKATGNQWAEVISEFSGGTVDNIFKTLSKPVQDKILKTSLLSAFKKVNPNKEITQFKKIIKEMGWDGTLNEMAEEQVGDVLRGVLFKAGLSDEEYKLPSKEQLALQLVSFSIPGVAISAINKFNTDLEEQRQSDFENLFIKPTEETKRSFEAETPKFKINEEALRNLPDKPETIKEQEIKEVKDTREVEINNKKVNIKKEDLAEMADFTDFVNGNLKLNEEGQKDMQNIIGDIAETYGFDSSLSDRKLANQFSKALDQVSDEFVREDLKAKVPEGMKKQKFKISEEGDLVNEINKAKSEGKTFDEFMESQPKIYRGQETVGEIKQNKNDIQRNVEDGIYFTKEKEKAKIFGEKIIKLPIAKETIVSFEERKKLQEMANKIVEEDIKNMVESDEIIEEMAINKPKSFAKYTNKPFVEATRDWGAKDEIIYYKEFDKTKQQLKEIWDKEKQQKSEPTLDEQTKEIPIEEARKKLSEIFTKDEVEFLTMKRLGKNVEGRYAQSMIKVLENNGKVKDLVVYHEAFHAYMDLFSNKQEKAKILSIVNKEYKKEVDAKKELYKRSGQELSDNDASEEILADKFALYLRDKDKIQNKEVKSFFEKLIEKIKKWITGISEIEKTFEKIATRTEKKDKTTRPAIPKLKIKENTKYKISQPILIDEKKYPLLTEELNKAIKEKIRNSEWGDIIDQAQGDLLKEVEEFSRTEENKTPYSLLNQRWEQIKKFWDNKKKTQSERKTQISRQERKPVIPKKVKKVGESEFKKYPELSKVTKAFIDKKITPEVFAERMLKARQRHQGKDIKTLNELNQILKTSQDKMATLEAYYKRITNYLEKPAKTERPVTETEMQERIIPEAEIVGAENIEEKEGERVIRIQKQYGNQYQTLSKAEEKLLEEESKFLPDETFEQNNELESQYQNFKDAMRTFTARRIEEIEDVEQLKKKLSGKKIIKVSKKTQKDDKPRKNKEGKIMFNKEGKMLIGNTILDKDGKPVVKTTKQVKEIKPETIDNFLYSQEMKDNEVFEIFKNRILEERKNRGWKGKIKAEKSKLNKKFTALDKMIKQSEKKSAEFSEGQLSGLGRGVAQGLQDAYSKINKRRQMVNIARDFFNLSDSDLPKLSTKNFMFMTDQSFQEYLDSITEKAMQLEVKRNSKNDLLNHIQEYELQKVDNLRKAMKLPTIDNMNTEQIEQFHRALLPFQRADEFLSQRKLETIDFTELKGVKTVREIKENLIDKIEALTGRRLTEEEIKAMSKVADSDKFKYDTALAEKSPFYNLMVQEVLKAQLQAERSNLRVEEDINILTRKARQSRKNIPGQKLKEKIGNKLVPQDKLVFTWLDSPPEIKKQVQKKMTKAEMDLALYIHHNYAKMRDYLIKVKALDRYRENYITYTQRSFLEAYKDDSLLTAIKEQIQANRRQQAYFDIIDDTGAILPLEKFFQFSLRRIPKEKKQQLKEMGEDAGIEPTKNVAKAFLTYYKSFTKKVQLDSVIPMLDSYVFALQDRNLKTPRGIELDKSLKIFFNDWMNSKKGRTVNMKIIKQGDKIDTALKAMNSLITIIDLGLNITVQTASGAGEGIMNFISLGAKDMAKGVRRKWTNKGRKMLKKYENFTGKGALREFTEVSDDISDTLIKGIFTIFKVNSVSANKTFLLGSITDEEWKSGEISNERLAQIKLNMGRYRAIEGSESIIGKTSAGKTATKYKTWAIPSLFTSSKNIKQMLKMLKSGKKDIHKTQEFQELFRATVIPLILYALFSADNDDDSFISELISKIRREMLSSISSLDPSFWTDTTRLQGFIKDLGTGAKQLIVLEKYKNSDEYKFHNTFMRTLVPSTIKKILPKDLFRKNEN